MDEAAGAWRGWRLGNLAPQFEPIAWLFKPYRIGGTIADNVLHYGVGAMNTAACAQDGRSPTNVLRFDLEPTEGRHHEAQKPIALLAYLIRLTTRPDQVVLDPFAGSGSTGVAALSEGRRFLGIEQDPRSAEIGRKRMASLHSLDSSAVLGGGGPYS
jgi:site-specific DNA-methyltransferase (adenine-specific)